MKISKEELSKLEFEFFSLNEEIDIYYCKTINKNIFDQIFNKQTLQEQLLYLVSMLENKIDEEKQYKLLQQLYIFSQGHFKLSIQTDEDDEEIIISEKISNNKNLANQIINKLDFYQTICQIVYQNLNNLQDKDFKIPTKQTVQLEQTLRLSLTILFNVIINSILTDQTVIDFSQGPPLLEEICFKSVKQSLEIPVIPIRKFLIIFYLLLKINFGEIQKNTDYYTQWKSLKYNKEQLLTLIEKENPRFNIQIKKDKTDYAQNIVPEVEKFYKRHMSNDNPIPQIIVVGILRVLLTTCPNAARNTGGIDLHSEWCSCIQFLYLHQEFFQQNGFESKYYTHKFMNEQIDQQEEQKEQKDYAILEEYQYENDRHRIIVAYIVSDFFIFMMKHFKSNHIIQFVYLSQLIVDANGVLVLLKFLNQDFGKIDFKNKLEQKYPIFQQQVSDVNINIEQISEFAIHSLLQLMYKTCKNQSERIKSYLVQYKAALIMKRLINKFDNQNVRKQAAKIIKIQIKFMNRNWRKNNMKVVSLVYNYVPLKQLDDWLSWENQQAGLNISNEDQEQCLSQDEIRHLNSDFNYKHYGQFYEKLEENQNEEDVGALENGSQQNIEEERQLSSQRKEKKSEQKNSLSGLYDCINENNLLLEMWQKAEVEDSFYQNYEKWLEDEVWSYYD